MILGTLYQPQKQAPHLFSGLAWHEFKAVEKLLDRLALVKQANTIPTTNQI